MPSTVVDNSLLGITRAGNLRGSQRHQGAHWGHMPISESKLSMISQCCSAQGGTRTRSDEYRQVPPGTSYTEIPGVCVSGEDRQGPAPADGGSKVVSALPISERDQVADQLEAVRAVWLRSTDQKTLRQALLDLLRQLENRK